MVFPLPGIYVPPLTPTHLLAVLSLVYSYFTFTTPLQPHLLCNTRPNSHDQTLALPPHVPIVFLNISTISLTII